MPTSTSMEPGVAWPLKRGLRLSLIHIYLTHYVSDLNRETNPELSAVLDDVLATPVSPELLPTTEDGQMTHFTEDLVGPYELHDFFLYYAIRCAFPPKKVFRLAEYVFDGCLLYTSHNDFSLPRLDIDPKR